MSARKTSDGGGKTLATNRKALRDYHVLDRFEAGLELRGAEVKSIRENRFSIDEAYAKLNEGNAFLHGFHIQAYEHAREEEQIALRPKRLLLHRKEIDRLFGQATIKGHALVPLRLYLKHGLVKVELGLCKGKHAHDKRETIKRKTAEREAARVIASRVRRDR